MNTPPESATNEPASPATPSRIQRSDGWTPERIRTFLCKLADGASATDAARAAGMSRQGAYAFRRSANGLAFAADWRAAQEEAERRRQKAVVVRAAAIRLHRLLREAQRRGIVIPDDLGRPDGMQDACRP